MKRTNKLPEIYFALSAAAAVIFAAVDIILMRSGYDWTLFLYESGSSAPLIFHTAAIVITALLCTSVIFARHAMLPRSAAPAGAFTSFCAGMTGCMLAGFGLMKLYYFMRGRYDMTARDTKLGLIAAFFAIAAALYFIITAVAKESRRAHSLPAFAVIITAALRLVEIYFGTASPINSPPRIIFEIAMLACMDYIITETRFIVGQPKPERYLAASCASIVLLALYAVPHLFFTFAGKYEIGPETLYSASMLFMALYIAGRMVRYLSMDAEPEPEPETDKTDSKEEYEEKASDGKKEESETVN